MTSSAANKFLSIQNRQFGSTWIAPDLSSQDKLEWAILWSSHNRDSGVVSVPGTIGSPLPIPTYQPYELVSSSDDVSTIFVVLFNSPPDSYIYCCHHHFHHLHPIWKIVALPHPLIHLKIWRVTISFKRVIITIVVLSILHFLPPVLSTYVICLSMT